jgi:hypothetical protein
MKIVSSIIFSPDIGISMVGLGGYGLGYITHHYDSSVSDEDNKSNAKVGSHIELLYQI